MIKWTDYLFVNAATLLWAGNVVLGRALRDAVGPWTLAAIRGAIASVLFGLLLWRTRAGPKGATRKDWGLIAAMALTGVVGFQVLLYAGLRSTTAVNAGLVNAAGPLVTVFLARLLLGTPLARQHVIGGLVSLVGVAIILSRGSWEILTSLRFNPGDLFVLGAVVCWALYSIAGRRLLERHPTVWVTATSTVLGALVLLGPAAWEWGALPPRWSPGVVAALLYIGAGPSFVAFLAWNEGVRRLGPSGAMAFYNTLPLYAGFVAALALGELPGPAQWVGGMLVVGGCLLAAGFPRLDTPPRPTYR
ncbi:DMT family transporter [Deferrisoma sp.]